MPRTHTPVRSTCVPPVMLWYSVPFVDGAVFAKPDSNPRAPEA